MNIIALSTKEAKMNALVRAYESEDRCPNCGIALNMAGNEREEILEPAVASKQKSFVDILLLPVGAVSGLLLFTFPLSLPLIYWIALLLVK